MNIIFLESKVCQGHLTASEHHFQP